MGKLIADLNISNYLTEQAAQTRKYAEQRITNEDRSCSNALLGILLLEGEGFRVPDARRFLLHYPQFTVKNMTDFQKIHKALGPLEKSGKPEPIGDGRSRMVKVTLRPKDAQFHNMEFQYEKQLPKGAKSKCRIKTVVTKHKVLVCDS